MAVTTGPGDEVAPEDTEAGEDDRPDRHTERPVRRAAIARVIWTAEALQSMRTAY